MSRTILAMMISSGKLGGNNNQFVSNSARRFWYWAMIPHLVLILILILPTWHFILNTPWQAWEKFLWNWNQVPNNAK